jgi:SAM-dependent methyltransferase
MATEFDFGGAIVPWGRTAIEYEAFFGLTDVLQSARVLDCGAGPASFCAEWTRKGRRVVAADPIYARPAQEIGVGFEHTADQMLEGMRRARERFHWAEYGSPERVVEVRRTALKDFLEDLTEGRAAGRYVAAGLPDLPFASGTFDLVLCSHLLFLYSDELSLDAHVSALTEMLRVGREVRVFPLLDMSGGLSNHLARCVSDLGHVADAEIIEVPYQFRIDDTRMVKLVRRGET